MSAMVASRPTSMDEDGAVISLPAPYLLFLGDTTEPGFAKTAFGLRDWAPEKCIGEMRLPAAKVTTGLVNMTPAEAAKRGARSLLIGVANSGGFIPESWLPALLDALQSGLDIISGMHTKLCDIAELMAAAERNDRRLIDIRTPPEKIAIASGLRRTGRRILTVGTDCALGKKYTALALVDGLRRRGVDVDFRASGQTGIMIAGQGIPIDAVVADFVAGAAEMLSPAAAAGHVDVIEGQGSLFHPAYAAVSLALLHGSQPDCFVVCHDPTRSAILGRPEIALPSIGVVIEQTIAMGRLTNPDIRCAGISLNTSNLAPEAGQLALQSVSAEYDLPAADPMLRGAGFERMLDACLE